MYCKIRQWRINDAQCLCEAINNKKIQDNLRDGIPFPYNIRSAEEFITAMLNSDKVYTKTNKILVVMYVNSLNK